MDRNLSQLWEIVDNRGAYRAAVHGVTDTTERLNNKPCPADSQAFVGHRTSFWSHSPRHRASVGSLPCFPLALHLPPYLSEFTLDESLPLVLVWTAPSLSKCEPWGPGACQPAGLLGAAGWVDWEALDSLSICTRLQGSWWNDDRSDQISRSVVSDSLQPHDSQHARPPCPSPTPGVHWDSGPSSHLRHPAISSWVFPFSSCP